MSGSLLEALFHSWNCQTSGVPRQSRGLTQGSYTAGRFIDIGSAVLEDEILAPQKMGCSCSLCPEKAHEYHQVRLMDALTHGAEDFLDMFRYLVFGAFAAAFIQTMIDQSFFMSLSGNAGLSIILMMGLAVLMSLCSEADAFVAASFQYLLPLAAQMAFMVLGPMFDIKLLFMSLSLFRRNAVAVIYGLTVTTVFIVMMIFHVFLIWVFS